MRFGTKKSEAVDDEDFQPYLRGLKPGDTEVRFLYEVDDWIQYREHFANKRSFPCTQDDNCGGCNSDDKDEKRASKKYATNLYLGEKDVVLPFKLPMTLAKKLFARAERNGGEITDRDYILIREGKGFDTEYDVDYGERSRVDINKLRADALDIEEILTNSYEEAWGPIDGEEAVEVTAAPWDDEEIDEDDLRKMTRPRLVKLAEKYKLDIDVKGSKEDILDAILEAA